MRYLIGAAVIGIGFYLLRQIAFGKPEVTTVEQWRKLFDREKENQDAVI